jgi:dihydroorotate dehydrogenase subfamily 2
VYETLLPLAFRIDPERTHDLALGALHWAGRLQLDALAPAPVEDPVTRLGLRFTNRVGLAAGLDKNGDAVEALGAFGFGFLEVGTVTPRPQPGNPKPRLFRIPEARALVNRLGFNNLGVEHLIRRLQHRRYAGVLGVNIGKNRDTPAERAAEDYERALAAVHRYADYVTVNLSSPNTPGLRDLQTGPALDALLAVLGKARARLADAEGRRAPMLVKIAPDLHDDDLALVAERLVAAGIDGIVATNTTLARDGVAGSPVAEEAGGLSGAPLHARSVAVVRRLRQVAGDGLVIVGVGGIDTAARAVETVRAGADLVQLYTGLVYRGPQLVRDAARALATLRDRDVRAGSR